MPCRSDYLWYLARARVGRGAGGGGGGAAPHFLKKKKGIFGGKRIFDWRTSRKYPNLWLVRFDPISQGEHKREWGTLFSLGKPQNDFLYKTALSRRLLRFHQPGDVVYAQRMESFLSRFSNLHGATISSLLKQTVLCIHVVENMKKFQELLQQSMINEPFSRSASFCCQILQPSEQEQVLFGSSKVKNKTLFTNNWRKVLNKAARRERTIFWSKWNARKSVMMLLCMVTLFLLLTPFSFVKLSYSKKKWLMSCNCIKKILTRHQVNPFKSARYNPTTPQPRDTCHECFCFPCLKKIKN